MEYTVRRATVYSIIYSPSVTQYPNDLTSEEDVLGVVNGTVVAALTSLDECDALKLSTLGSYRINLSTSGDLLKILSRLDSKSLDGIFLNELILGFKASAKEIARRADTYNRGVSSVGQIRYGDWYGTSSVVGEGPSTTRAVSYSDPAESTSAEEYVARAGRAISRNYPLFTGIPKEADYEETRALVAFARPGKGVGFITAAEGQNLLREAFLSGHYPWLAHLRALPALGSFATEDLPEGIGPQDYENWLGQLTTAEARDLLIDDEKATPIDDADGRLPYILDAATAYYIDALSEGYRTEIKANWTLDDLVNEGGTKDMMAPFPTTCSYRCSLSSLITLSTIPPGEATSSSGNSTNSNGRMLSLLGFYPSSTCPQRF